MSETLTPREEVKVDYYVQHIVSGLLDSDVEKSVKEAKLREIVKYRVERYFDT